MKLSLIAAASVAALAIGSGTASAQYQVVPHRNHLHVVPAQPQVLVPHYGHYHAVPAYQPPVYGGFGYQQGYSSFGGYQSGFGYGSPGYGSGYRSGYGSSYGSSGGHNHGHNHR